MSGSQASQAVRNNKHKDSEVGGEKAWFVRGAARYRGGSVVLIGKNFGFYAETYYSKVFTTGVDII